MYRCLSASFDFNLIKFPCISVMLSFGDEFINWQCFYKIFFAIIPSLCTIFWMGVGLNYYISLNPYLIMLFDIIFVTRSMSLSFNYNNQFISYYQPSHFMGGQSSRNQQSNIQINPPSEIIDIGLEQNQSPLPQVNYQTFVVQLRFIVQNVLKELKNEGENVFEFEKQLKKNNKQIMRGENFQGRINENKQIYGMAKYFIIKNQIRNIYIGQCVNGKPVGRALNVRAFPLVILSENNQQHLLIDKLDKENYQAFLLQQWSISNQQISFSQNIREGCMIKRSKNITQFFKGKFKGSQIYRGRLIVRQNQKIKLEYIGDFNNSLIQGRGTLIVPDKYRYEGNFHHQKKSGIGYEFDYVRHTEYIGEFQNDKRNGYGELIYKNRNNVRLKGFWTDGIIKPGDGMYVRHDGVFLQHIGDDIQLL